MWFPSERSVISSTDRASRRHSAPRAPSTEWNRPSRSARIRISRDSALWISWFRCPVGTQENRWDMGKSWSAWCEAWRTPWKPPGRWSFDDHGGSWKWSTYTGTDHTREKVPFIAYSPSMKEKGMFEEQKTFGVIGATVLDNFGLKKRRIWSGSRS